MLSITIPLWIVATIVAIPSVTALALIIRLIRLKRKKRDRQSGGSQPSALPGMVSSGSGHHMYHQLLEQQIDAVFNALLTVIESERHKLKAIVNHPVQMASIPIPASLLSQPTPVHQVSEQETATVGQSIAASASEGMKPEDIARQMGISQAEVDLAMKLNPNQKAGLGRSLEAVA